MCKNEPTKEMSRETEREESERVKKKAKKH